MQERNAQLVDRLDDRDRVYVAAAMMALDRVEGPRVGDFVRFADGTLRRCSYHWRDDAGWDGGMQTSDGGSYHLLYNADRDWAGVSMSGSLCRTVPTESLTLTGEQLDGSLWIFHHGLAGAGRGVAFAVPFRVYACELDPPR